MINLIPKEEKKKINRGFYYRLSVVYLMALSFPILICLAVMIPSYFLVRIKGDLIEKKLAVQKAEPVPLLDQETLRVITDLNHKLNIVKNAENNKFVVSQKIINAIVLKKMPDIKITDIAFKNIERITEEEIVVQDKKISIQGIAPSRPRLLLFRQILEDDANFQDVDLPISNFIKGSNIQFYLSLTPRAGGEDASPIHIQ